MRTTEEEMGIEGILSRLQKQRNLTFGLSLDEKEDRTYLPSNNGKDDWHPKFSNDMVSWCVLWMFNNWRIMQMSYFSLACKLVLKINIHHE